MHKSSNWTFISVNVCLILQFWRYCCLSSYIILVYLYIVAEHISMFTLYKCLHSKVFFIEICGLNKG